MRKTKLVVSISLLILLLTGCTLDKFTGKKNSITLARLTDREKAIISTVSNSTFVYEYKVDDSYKEANVWVEKYEFGKNVGKINEISTEIENEGTVIFSVFKTSDNNETRFSLSLSSEKGISSTTVEEKIPKDLNSAWGADIPIDYPAPVSEKMVLGSLIFSGKSSISTLSSDFKENVEGQVDEIKAYDVVYIIRCTFQ